MAISRKEVLAHRQELMEDVVESLVPEIDEALLSAETFPVTYEVTQFIGRYPKIGRAIVDLYTKEGWQVRETIQKDDYSDRDRDRDSPTHYNALFSLEPIGEPDRNWDDR